MKSKFAQHLLENKHSIDSIDKIMDIIHITRKRKMMDMIEKFCIYRETKLNNQINDKPTVKPNVIFKTLVRQDPQRGIPSTYCTMLST
jgi:ferritin-like metal-binding protein YciE